MTKEEILNDEMSDKFMQLINQSEPLRQWIYDAMEEYAQQQVKLLSIKQFTFDCWFKDSGKPIKMLINSINEEEAIKIFEENHPDMGYDYPYDSNE